MKLKDLLPILSNQKLNLREKDGTIYTALFTCYRHSPTLEYYKDRTVLTVSIGDVVEGFVITLAK